MMMGVALRKESVDRNIGVLPTINLNMVSLSARRAWIEILTCSYDFLPGKVALRKESVDRNYTQKRKKAGRMVALRKESVDRNSTVWTGCVYHITSLSARRA